MVRVVLGKALDWWIWHDVREEVNQNIAGPGTWRCKLGFILEYTEIS